MNAVTVQPDQIPAYQQPFDSTLAALGTDARRAEILKTNEELAGRALRTLGIADRSLSTHAVASDEVDERVERDLVFAGLIGTIDPPREEARDAVARAKGAGIRPMMITGADVSKEAADIVLADGTPVVLPLLATQLLWINLVTNRAPALALGIDPADAGLMHTPPRPKGEGVITRRMWFGIFFVGSIMAVGTLFVVDASLPGGLVHGSGDMRYAQTMAFTTEDLFKNHWLWAAVGVSLVLHVAVLYMPLLQQAV